MLNIFIPAVLVLAVCVAALLLYRQVNVILQYIVQTAVFRSAAEEKDGTRESADKEHSAEIVKREKFEHIVGRILGGGGQHGCFLLINVDRFAEINDAYGASVGDAVLEGVASVFRDYFKKNDYICRLEQDEFAVWLSDMTKECGDDVRWKIAVVNDKLMHIKGGLPPISVSAGAVFDGPSEEYRDLYKRANMALREVKEGGRCGCAVH